MDHDSTYEFSYSDSTPNSCHSSKFEVSPNMTKYWTPMCVESCKPHVGMIFTNVAVGFQFYKQYATLCGFDIRKSTSRKSSDGVCVWKYILCNREGFKNLPKPTNLESSSCVGDETESMNTESSSSNCENIVDCNEELKSSEPKNIPSNKRRRVSNRVGCNARLVMRLHAEHGYVVTCFEERHNHPMA